MVYWRESSFHFDVFDSLQIFIKVDSLKHETFDKYGFDAAKDFYLELKYPSQNGFYITHISALAEQSSSVVRAYTVDGGIGYNYMTLVFEAKRITYFYYRIYLFGRKYQ